MYIYNVKYNGQIIAAADNDERADQIIKQYMRDNKSMDMSLFEKEPIRFFGEFKENRDMELKVKKVRDNAVLPTRGSEKAAGVDLYACLDKSYIKIVPNEVRIIPTGIACDFPEGYFGEVVVRSSVGAKRKLRLSNQIGIIDNDYKGEIMLAIYNGGEAPALIEQGERLAQMVLLPYTLYNIVETDTLSETERGEGGFGSTGR